MATIVSHFFFQRKNNYGENWSDQNRSSRTACYGHDIYTEL